MRGIATYQGEVGRTFAGAQVQFDLVTDGDDQYIAFFNVDRNIVIKHRKVDVNGSDGPWTSRIIQESSYNPDSDGRSHSYKTKWDSHNWLRLAVDGSGNLHVAGDMHNTELRYWRTSTPRDLSTLQRRKPLVSAANESSATYPEFIDRPNGNLGWLIFRNGRSGDGDTHVYEWNNTAKTWSQVSRPFAGTSPYFSDGTGSAYWEVFRTLDDWFHILFNWREDGNANSNSKFSYLKTRDFSSYYNSVGQTVTVPIKGANNTTVVDTLPTSKDANGVWIENGLINNEYQFITVGEFTVLAYTKLGLDSNGGMTRQVWVARCDLSGGWNIAQVTKEPGGVGLIGNGYIDNYIGLLNSTTLAIDYGYDGMGRPSRRVLVPLFDFDSGPFESIVAPPYYPSSVYQVPDSALPGVTGHTKADSRSHEQTNGLTNRNYIASRPISGNVLYVVSWLAGPDMFAPPNPMPSQAVIDSWPERQIIMNRIDY